MRPLLAITLLFLLPLCHVAGQDAGSSRDLDKAKAAIRGSADDAPDYNKAGLLLQKIVAREPDNAEAWYFLGYAIDKTNAPDGEHMPNVRLELTRKASEAFEHALAPGKDVYTGDLLVFDPHTKILTVWGTQAIHYLYNGDKDSAVWCYQQAAHRGGINRTMLDYFRDVLDECPHDAWLFFNGDAYLYYINCLQLVEKYRADVDCVDVNLLNTAWYPNWMVTKNLFKTSWAPGDLAKLTPVKWETQTVGILKNASRDTLLSWSLAPTSDDKKHLTRSSGILLDILQQNALQKETYFAGDVPAAMMLYLRDYLQDRGLTSRLAVKKQSTDLAFVMERLHKLRNLPASPRDYLNNRDNVQLLNNYRFAFTTAANIAWQRGDSTTARQLITGVERKYPAATLPFFAEETKQWFEQLKKK